MNCTCKKDIETRLLNKLKADRPDGEGHHAHLDGYGFALTDDNKMLQVGGTPITLTVMTPKKAGGMKLVRINQTMVWTFCPFCGAQAKGGAA